MGTAIALIGAGVNTIVTNVWADIVEFMVGIAAIVVYEKFPPGTPDSFPDVPPLQPGGR